MHPRTFFHDLENSPRFRTRLKPLTSLAEASYESGDLIAYNTVGPGPFISMERTMKIAFLAVRILCAGLLGGGILPAASQVILPSVTTSTIAPVSTSDDQAQQFEGVIISKNGELFVLRDDVNDTWYHLDDQKAAGKFLGKKVLVTGTLDTRTDVIRVQKITEES